MPRFSGVVGCLIDDRQYLLATGQAAIQSLIIYHLPMMFEISLSEGFDPF